MLSCRLPVVRSKLVCTLHTYRRLLSMQLQGIGIAVDRLIPGPRIFLSLVCSVLVEQVQTAMEAAVSSQQDRLLMVAARGAGKKEKKQRQQQLLQQKRIDQMQQQKLLVQQRHQKLQQQRRHQQQEQQKKREQEQLLERQQQQKEEEEEEAKRKKKEQQQQQQEEEDGKVKEEEQRREQQMEAKQSGLQNEATNVMQNGLFGIGIAAGADRAEKRGAWDCAVDAAPVVEREEVGHGENGCRRGHDGWWWKAGRER